MTRKQKAAQLARRRDAQAKHRGRIKIHDAGSHKIELPAGPQPSRSFHRTDPMAHGEELRKREQIVSFCAAIGFNPSPAQIDLMRDLMNEGRLTQQAIERLANPLQRLLDAPLYGFFAVDGKTGERVDPRTLLPHRPKIERVHSDEVELMGRVLDGETYDKVLYGEESEGKTLSSLDTVAKVQEDGRTLYMDPELDTMALIPTEEEWAELETAAKRRRRGARGYVRVLEEAGYVLGKDTDPKDRKSWVRA